MSYPKKIAGTAKGSAVAFDHFTTEPLESKALYWRCGRAMIKAVGEPLKFLGYQYSILFRPLLHERLKLESYELLILLVLPYQRLIILKKSFVAKTFVPPFREEARWRIGLSNGWSQVVRMTNQEMLDIEELKRSSGRVWNGCGEPNPIGVKALY